MPTEKSMPQKEAPKQDPAFWAAPFLVDISDEDVIEVDVFPRWDEMMASRRARIAAGILAKSGAYYVQQRDGVSFPTRSDLSVKEFVSKEMNRGSGLARAFQKRRGNWEKIYDFERKQDVEQYGKTRVKYKSPKVNEK